MVVIELHNRRYNPRERQIDTTLAARIVVDGADLRVTAGNPAWAEAIKDFVLIHPDTEEDLTFASDPELWAERLPLAFDGGDMTAVAQREERVTAAAEPVYMAAERRGWS